MTDGTGTTLRLLRLRHSLDVGDRRRDVLRRVRLAGQEEIEPGVCIHGDPDDHPLDRGCAQEEILVRGELDEFARLPPHPAIGAAPDGMRRKLGPGLGGRRQRLQQVRRHDRGVKGGVVELLRVHLPEAEDDPMLTFRLDGADPAGDIGEARRDGGVPGAAQGEEHVAGGDRRPVVPARAGVEIEDEGEGVTPRPAAGEHRHEPLVASGHHSGADIGQAKEQLVGHVLVGERVLAILDQRRHRGGGLLPGDDDDARGVAVGEKRPHPGHTNQGRGEHESRRPGHHGAPRQTMEGAESIVHGRPVPGHRRCSGAPGPCR